MENPGGDFYRALLDNLNEGVYFVDLHRRISYWNRAAEALTGRSADEVMGHRCADNILAHVDEKGTQLCISGCPLAATMLDGVPRQTSAYMLHKQGHRVPVSIRVNPIRNGQGLIVGGVESFSDNTPSVALQKRLHELENMALVDTLTGIGNRRYAEMYLEERFSGLKRYKWPFGVLMCDIDNFKAVNDRYGHNAGDTVLKMVAGTLSASVRDADAVFRWGGEEFLGVISNVSDIQLGQAAERMRRLVAASSLPHDDEMLRVTISIGGTHASAGDNPLTIIEQADEQLYKSKSEGKNRCNIA